MGINGWNSCVVPNARLGGTRLGGIEPMKCGPSPIELIKAGRPEWDDKDTLLIDLKNGEYFSVSRSGPKNDPEFALSDYSKVPKGTKLHEAIAQKMSDAGTFEPRPVGIKHYVPIRLSTSLWASRASRK